MGLLSLAIWAPIVFGTLLLALGKDEHANAVRWMALAGAVFSLLVTVPVYTGFVIDSADMQHVEKVQWIERCNIHYH